MDLLFSTKLSYVKLTQKNWCSKQMLSMYYRRSALTDLYHMELYHMEFSTRVLINWTIPLRMSGIKL